MLANTGTNFWIRLACSTSPVWMFPFESTPTALIQWSWPAYFPLLPNDPSVFPLLRSRIQTWLFVPSATYKYFCSGSFEKTILQVVPHGGIFVLGGRPPQSSPREGVFGDT